MCIQPHLAAQESLCRSAAFYSRGRCFRIRARQSQWNAGVRALAVPANKIHIIGIGDDGLEGLTAAGRQLIEGADLLIGAEPTLAQVPGGRPNGCRWATTWMKRSSV